MNAAEPVIPPRLVEHILVGSADDRRQLQDSPILGDVWLAYGETPDKPRDLLVTPHRASTAAEVARELRNRLKEAEPSSTRIAHLQGVVAVRLHFDELLTSLVPMTQWWHDNHMFEGGRDLTHQSREGLAKRLAPIFTGWERKALQEPAGYPEFSSRDRYIALAGLILWARARLLDKKPIDVANELADPADFFPHVIEMLRLLYDIYGRVAKSWKGASDEKKVFQVALNRPAKHALDRSVPAVKGDAARTLFSVSCKDITWAVIDSGIQADHPAFRLENGKSRVIRALDFTSIRQVLSLDRKALQPIGERLVADRKASREEVESLVQKLEKSVEEDRPTDWNVVEKLLACPSTLQPGNPHGTHVAGIIGGAQVKQDGETFFGGMCPDINLYDIRVLGQSSEDTEFAVMAALQYIRFVNEKHNAVIIHGANLSLSIPHNVRNFACGRTPICNESQRLVESGVVVVAAAGNRGYHEFQTKEGTYEGYAAFSITDPGNAEDVITVGSTHGNWPHTYGVSFFSSRGPTGDGRPKPDLVAPGERIQAPYLGGEWRRESGTSMAAPHVSGAAAMLMARYRELIGNPRRIKQILCSSATDLGRERSFQGSGMLDVLRAFQSI